MYKYSSCLLKLKSFMGKVQEKSKSCQNFLSKCAKMIGSFGSEKEPASITGKEEKENVHTFGAPHWAPNAKEAKSVKIPIDEKPQVSSEVAPKKSRNRCLGILLETTGALFYSLSTLQIKILEYDPFNLNMWRFIVTLVGAVPFLIHGHYFGSQRKTSAEDLKGDGSGRYGVFRQVWPPSRTTLFLVLQAILMTNQMALITFGVHYLNIGDSAVIETSAPVFVTFVAWLFLRERFGVVSFILAVVALIGVGIICKPPMITGAASIDVVTLKGVIFSVASMVLLTFCYVILRYLRKVHHSLLVMSFAIWSILQNGIVGGAIGVIHAPRNVWEVALIFSSAILASSGQTCLILALKYEQAGVVALVRTVEAIFCYFWEALVLGNQPDIFSIIGAVVTLSCVVIAALRNIAFSLESGNSWKKCLHFLTY